MTIYLPRYEMCGDDHGRYVDVGCLLLSCHSYHCRDSLLNSQLEAMQSQINLADELQTDGDGMLDPIT